MGMALAVRRFTVDEYHRMADAGIFLEDDRVELIDGQVVEMSPIKPRHARCVDDLNRLLTRQVGSHAIVRIQNPVILGAHHEPQPDLALVRPRADRYGEGHPEPADILLLIEVADTSLRYDRERKLPLYAQAGIPEVWLVNLPAGRMDVCRNPQGRRYTAVRTAIRGETVSPLAFPMVSLRVDDILG